MGIRVPVDIEVEDIIDGIRNQDNETVYHLVETLDLNMQDVEFTLTLIDRLLASLKADVDPDAIEQARNILNRAETDV